MTDIQSLLNIVSTPSNELEQSALSQLTQSQLTQVKQLQQLLQQLNLPPKASQQLISALIKETVNVTNLSVTNNKLSFTLSQLTPKLVELTLPSQPLQLQTDKAQLSLTTNLSELLINLPKQSIKLPQQVIFQLLKLATNSAETTQGKFAIPAQITNLDKHLLVKANHVAISAELPKNLASLVKHQQPAIIEVENKREQLSLNIKLDKHSQPVQSQVLPIKKAIELVKLQSPLLQFDAKKAPALSINNSPVLLTNTPQVITNQKLTFNLHNLGDKAVLNLPSQVFKVALNSSQAPFKIAPRELISAPQLAVKELPNINSVAATQKSFSQSVIAPMLASIKAVLFERNITLNHATKGSVNLPKLEVTNVINTNNTLNNRMQEVANYKLPLLTTVKENTSGEPVYSRPIVAAPSQHQNTQNSKSDLLPSKSASFNTKIFLVSEELPFIKSVTPTHKSLSQTLIAPMLAGIKAVLFERNITLNHTSKGNVSLPKLDLTNVINTNNTLNNRMQEVASFKLPLLTTVKDNTSGGPVYSRPIVAAPSVDQNTQNSKSDLSSSSKVTFEREKVAQQKLEFIAKQNPLQTLALQLHKNTASPLLPEPLTKLVNSAFSRMINESTPLQPVMMQIKSITDPTNLSQMESIQTPIGAIEHAKISIASNGLLQQNSLVSDQQGKLENLLPLLLSLTKGLNSKKEIKSPKGQLALPSTLQRSLSDSLTSLQKSLLGTSQSNSQQTSPNEQPLVNMQFSLPQQQTEKLSTTPVTIEEERRRNSDGEVVSIWYINLAFEINNHILNIGAELNKQKLSLNFSSDNSNLINKAKMQSPLLTQKLTQHGIEILRSEFNLTEQQQLKTRSGIVNIKV